MRHFLLLIIDSSQKRWKEEIMKKVILSILLLTLAVGVGVTNSETTSVVAEGNIRGMYLTDTYVFYSTLDNTSKLYSLNMYALNTGETTVIVKDRKKISMFPTQQSSIYASNGYCVWLETNGLWGFNAITQKPVYLSNINFNNGIGVWCSYCALSMNYKNKKGIYLVNIATSEASQIFEYKYPHQTSSLKVANGYVTWVDRDEPENPRDSAKVIGGDILLYNITTKIKETVDDSEGMKGQPIIGKNYVFYMKYKNSQIASGGATIMAYNLTTKTRQSICEVPKGSNCTMVMNPDSDQLIISYRQKPNAFLKAIMLDTWEVSTIAQKENVVINFITNSQMAFGDKVIWTQNNGTDMEKNWTISYLEDISKATSPQTLSAGNNPLTTRITNGYTVWGEYISDNNSQGSRKVNNHTKV
jgi:hypothetical protein